MNDSKRLLLLSINQTTYQFDSRCLLVVILLLICTCIYIHDFHSKLLNRYKTGFRGTFWKFARIGQRQSQYVSIFCLGMALSVLFLQQTTSIEHDQPSIIVAESFDGSYHLYTFHPQQTCLVATANARQEIELYDIRLSKSPVLCYGAPIPTSRKISTIHNDIDVKDMSVTFNSDGCLLYDLRRRLPPVLLKLHQSKAFCQFDADNYVNLCRMKSGCFVGDCDQYITTGSDDFNVYIWRIPDNDYSNTNQCHSSSHLNS
ncbi:unnamed protein product, partial [Rotaria sp. Silwood2]